MANKSATATPAEQGTSRLFLLAIAAVVVVGLGVVAVVAGGSGDADSATDEVAGDGAETAAVSITGDPLELMPEGVQVSDAATDPTVGTIAPTVTGTTFDGTEVTIGPDGSAKVIYFVAHWCPHCQAEVPLVQGLIDAGAVPDGLEVYAVSTSVDDGRGNYPPSGWFAEEGFTPTVIRDDDATSALSAFGATSFPFAVYLDAEHQVVARTAGSLDAETTELLWQAAVS